MEKPVREFLIQGRIPRDEFCGPANLLGKNITQFGKFQTSNFSSRIQIIIYKKITNKLVMREYHMKSQLIWIFTKLKMSLLRD